MAPVWFHRADDGLLLLGGLQSQSRGRTVFTILTTRPSALIAPTHDRMPLLVAPAALDDWLEGDCARALDVVSAAAAGELVGTQVSKHVNSARHDDREWSRRTPASARRPLKAGSSNERPGPSPRAESARAVTAARGAPPWPRLDSHRQRPYT
jgi:hypothetical protein